MSALQLYQDRCYHRVILLAPSCVTLVDLVCLYLSLAGIGRKQAAVTLLQIRIEEETDPAHKITLLRCIHDLTQNNECLEEIQYWESLNVAENAGAIWQLVKPVPSCESASCVAQVSGFVRNHAFIHPESFAYSVLEDSSLSKTVREMWDLSILEVVERCGSLQSISDRIGNTLTTLDEQVSPEQPEVMEQIQSLANLDLLRKRMVAISRAYLQGDLNRALEESLLYIKVITDIRQVVITPTVRGLLDFDIETVCMISSQCVTKDTPERILDYLLRQLLNPGEVVSVGDYEYSRRELRSPFRVSQLRRSAFFLSCGHIFRAKALRNSRIVSVDFGREKIPGVVLNRVEGLEMARKYVIAAALQPLDNPRLHDFYDQAAWSLMLCGGIELHVLWFFLVLKSLFYRQTFFSFSEPCRSFAYNSMGPSFLNRLDMFKEFCRMCEKSEIRESFEFNLLPTLVEVQKKVYRLTQYAEDMDLCTFERNQLVPNISGISEITASQCVESSHEILDIWVSVYREIHGEIPMEAEVVLKDFRMRGP